MEKKGIEKFASLDTIGCSFTHDREAILENSVDEVEPLSVIDNSSVVSRTDKGTTVLHKANSRGQTKQDWLESYHTFSYGGYRNPQRTHFGMLRILNDYRLEGGSGFEMHPHDNMEIVSILLDGALEHKDIDGNKSILKKGAVQVISAGRGISHSEYNISATKPVHFLQLWLYPDQKNVAPRYQEINLRKGNRKNTFQTFLSPKSEDDGAFLQQQAWFHIGVFDAAKQIEYNVKKTGNGVYVFIISGTATIEGQILEKRDGYGVWNTEGFTIIAETATTEILLVEVPMRL